MRYEYNITFDTTSDQLVILITHTVRQTYEVRTLGSSEVIYEEGVPDIEATYIPGPHGMHLRYFGNPVGLFFCMVMGCFRDIDLEIKAINKLRKLYGTISH